MEREQCGCMNSLAHDGICEYCGAEMSRPRLDTERDLRGAVWDNGVTFVESNLTATYVKYGA